MKDYRALSAGVSQRRDDCFAYRAIRVAELGATRREVIETIPIAGQMRGGPSMVGGGQALEGFDSIQGTTSAPTQEKHHAHYQS